MCRGSHLKDCLKQAPVLLFIDAAIFQFKTDASAVGLAAVLKQNGHPSSSHAPPEYKRPSVTENCSRVCSEAITT